MDYISIEADCEDASNPERCRLTKKTWERDYNAAIKGDYQGQRNVAYCLSTGCSYEGFRKNPVLGCAWRVVIINSGHLDADQLDANSLKLFCGPEFLDDVGRTMADAQARTLLGKLGRTEYLP